MPPARAARTRYHWLLRKVLRHRLTTVLCALAALVLSIYGTTFMQGEFFPASDRPELLVSLTLPANASQPETQRGLKSWRRRWQAIAISIITQHTWDRAPSVFICQWMCCWRMKNSAQLVVVAKNLAARDRLHAQLNKILATQFSDIITRVSPSSSAPVGWANQIPG